MLEATIQTLEEEMECWGVEYIRVALNHNQIKDLPNDPTAAKTSDMRYRNYVERFGNVAVELDALHPQILQELAVRAIESQFDMDRFREQQEIEKMERKKLAAKKRTILELLDKYKDNDSDKDNEED